MKRIKNTILLAMLLSITGLKVSAQTLFNGIYYNLDDTKLEATVTSGTNEYTGAVVIPSSVTYNSKTYSVTSIGERAFYYCSGLTSVTIPNSVTRIGEQAFSSCWRLTSVTIPNSVTSIGNYAFDACSSLTSITIPNSVTSIGSSAFAYCFSLTTISIPNSVTSIGNSAFSGCSSLTTISISNSVTSIGWSAFYRTAWLEKQPDGLVYAGLNVYTYKGTMPENTTLTIKDGTKSICSYALSNHSGLISVTIPESVTSIGECAFYYCSGLTSVTIPNSITSIGRKAFAGTKWLNDQPDGLVYAGLNVYTYKGTIPENTTLTIKDGTKSICSDALSNQSGLISVTIPESVTSIGECAFYYCSGLTSVTIPNSITSIGNSTFYNCTGLTSIAIGNSLTSIGIGAFLGCSSLNKVIVSDIAAWCGISFESNDANPLFYAKHLYSDENAEIIDLVIPKGVTSIGSYAFYGLTEMKSIVIPASVESIGNNAFYGCKKLLDVVTLITSPVSIPDNAFTDKTYADGSLYIPVGTKGKYQVRGGWKNFVYMEEGVPAGIDHVANEGVKEAARYTLGGKRVATPQPGLNIIRMTDGSTRKVVVK